MSSLTNRKFLSKPIIEENKFSKRGVVLLASVSLKEIPLGHTGALTWEEGGTLSLVGRGGRLDLARGVLSAGNVPRLEGDASPYSPCLDLGRGAPLDRGLPPLGGRGALPHAYLTWTWGVWSASPCWGQGTPRAGGSPPRVEGAPLPSRGGSSMWRESLRPGSVLSMLRPCIDLLRSPPRIEALPQLGGDGASPHWGRGTPRPGEGRPLAGLES
ncbi:UNVERIFIED_CONTAM: hypothetical protein Sradi_3013200 [Sesamum radiatum]|uniref:Uncharacterized protein n=1 Tax=Sesamum radiatum TaxID=300843 RepID=A0AAW2S199_SESRA